MDKTKRRLNGRRVRAEATHQLKGIIEDHLLLTKEWLVDYGKVILPAALLVLVSVTSVLSLNARSKVEAAENVAASAIEETKEDLKELTEDPFEVDAYPEVNNFITRYYAALLDADIEVISELQSVVTNTETIRLRKMSEYIDRYENFKVYTKHGPYSDTYVAYVYTDIYLKDRTEAIPGLQAFYICTGQNGQLYINAGELSEQEADYLLNISEQSDVVDLKNQVSVAYNSLLESSEDFNNYWAKLSVEIDTSVSEQLALDARLVAQLEQETGVEDDKEPENNEGTSEEVVEVPKVIKVKTTAYVNVRKSASATGDIIGGARLGAVYEVIEVMNNGWTKVKYENSEGFISSAYLEEVESVENYETLGTVTALTTLNVRQEPNADSTRIGVLSQGESVDLIERLQGWCKIKFKGQVGYVSSEYVD